MRGVDNFQEVTCVEAGAPDQGPIDVRLLEQGSRVFGLDASPVLNAQALGRGWTVNLGQASAEKGMSLLSLGGGRIAARADRPDWLIRHDHTPYCIRADAGERTR